MGQVTQSTEQIQQQLNGVYGEIYTHENVTGQVIPTGAGYTLIENYTGNGESNQCTSDYTNSVITLTEPGIYMVDFSSSFTEAGSNENWFVAAFVNGVEQDKIHFERRIGTGGDYGSAGCSGTIVASTAPVDVDMRVRHGNAGSRTLTMRYSNLRVFRIAI